MKKVLIVETNVQKYGDTNDATGLWLGESAEFVDELQKVGWQFDFVSPKGGFVPLDPRSMKYVDAAIMKVYEDPTFIDKALRNTLKPEDVDPSAYDAIYYTGGHGVMWDFPDDPALSQIATEIYTAGGYLTSVCHGIAGLFNVKDGAGQYVIANKKITGFTTSEEVLAGKKKVVPFLNQEMAEQRGAQFVKKHSYQDNVVTDGQLITGQNPFSVRSVAKALIQAEA